jgi:tetratricopeptide (TPR) repeat protein
MKAKPPPERRKFAGIWDEIDYLRHKLLYWLYQRADLERARPHAEQLERLLPKADPTHGAILGEECWSLVCEAKGDFQGAIKHRKKEIRLIRRLQRIAHGAPEEAALLEGYGFSDLSDRLDLLATLYHDSGQLEKAIGILKQSKKLCLEHRVKFDAEDVLREYMEERKNPAQYVE